MPNRECSFSLRDGVIQFDEPTTELNRTWVPGPVINATTDKTEKLRDWKVTVGCAIKDVRGKAPWSPKDLYAVTLEFRFHRNQTLDVDNFVKPVLDGLAAGLFCPEDKEPREIPRFDINHGIDDSNFRILLIHRLPDPPHPKDEGVRLFVSSTRP